MLLEVGLASLSGLVLRLVERPGESESESPPYAYHSKLVLLFVRELDLLLALWNPSRPNGYSSSPPESRADHPRSIPSSSSTSASEFELSDTLPHASAVAFLSFVLSSSAHMLTIISFCIHFFIFFWTVSYSRTAPSASPLFHIFFSFHLNSALAAIFSRSSSESSSSSPSPASWSYHSSSSPSPS